MPVAELQNTRRRLQAECAQARRACERAEQRREAAERALSDHDYAERLADLGDPHPRTAPTVDGRAAWEGFVARLRELVDDNATFGVFLTPLHPHRRQDGVWVIGCPAGTHAWVQARFGTLLGHVVREMGGKGVRLVICNDNERSTG